MPPSFREALSDDELDALGFGGCHILADARATAKVGPDLGKVLKTRDEAFIRESIVKPNAFVERPYPRNVMPRDFGRSLSKAEIDALVAYLDKATS